MDINQLNQFRDLIATLKEMNEASKVTYVMIKSNDVTIRDNFYIGDLHTTEFIIVIGGKTRINGPFRNWENFIMGMFNVYLEIIDHITFSNNWKLVDIRFKMRNYEAIQPEIILRSPKEEEKRLECKYLEDIGNLIKEAQSL